VAVELDHSFSTAKPIDESYATILDLDRVVPCVDGGSVLETLGPESVRAQIKIKMGAMSMTFTGTLEVVEQDAAAHRAVMSVKAKEAERLASAEASWREKSARALAEVTERCEKLEASLAAERARADAAPSATETERALRQLHGELTDARKSAADGEKALAQLRADRDQAEERSRQERESAQPHHQDGGGASHRQKARARAAKRGLLRLIGIVGLHHALLEGPAGAPPVTP